MLTITVISEVPATGKQQHWCDKDQLRGKVSFQFSDFQHATQLDSVQCYRRKNNSIFKTNSTNKCIQKRDCLLI